MSESPCEGIRLHFLLRRKLMFRCHPAGSLDLIFESRCKGKKKDTQRVSFFWRSRRDSNPCTGSPAYEISSHASSTSLSTAPYNRIIIPTIRKKINCKLQ